MHAQKFFTISKELIAELKIRAVIGLLFLLIWQLGRLSLKDITNGGIYLSIQCIIEIISIVMVSRIGGNKQITNGINEFNFYALFVHIIGIPAFYSNINSNFHNYTIWLLFYLSIARLLYFGPFKNGDYQGFPTFGLLANVQKFYAKRTQFKYLSEVLFFGSAIPLWFIMWKTNDPQVTITVVGVMLFIYIMTFAIKTQAEVVKTVVLEPESNPDAVSVSAPDAGAVSAPAAGSVSVPDAVSALLLKIFNEKSEAEKVYLMKLIAIDHAFTAAEPEVEHPENEAEVLLLEGYARKYYYPLGKLMQLLPGDITNRSSLTAEQANKCLALCRFAESACTEIKSGLLTIDLLQEMATVSKIRRPIPDCAKLIAHLEIELEFFQQCISDYGDAARHIEKVWPTAEDGKRRRSHAKK